MQRRAPARPEMSRSARAAPPHQVAKAADNTNARGTVLVRLGLLEDALESYQAAILRKPDHAGAYCNRALVNLMLGRFTEGWKDYLWRAGVDRRQAPRPRAPLPADLSGVGIVIRCEQGLGDELFFLRFARALKARGAWLAYGPDPRLASMLSRVPFLDEVVAPGITPSGADMMVALGDLPYLSGATPSEAPPLELPPAAARLERVGARLAALGPPPYVGLTWRAGVKSEGKLYKEVELDRLGRALGGLDATFIALLRAPDESEFDRLVRAIGRPAPTEPERLAGILGRPVHDLGSLNNDLEDMLALLHLLDDYVSVSNTNVHLRAGTGRSSCVLVPHPPEFRWMTEGHMSPWFPDHPIFRQSRDGDWSSALSHLTRELGGRRTAAARTARPTRETRP